RTRARESRAASASTPATPDANRLRQPQMRLIPSFTSAPPISFMTALITKMRDTRTDIARPTHTTFPLAATLNSRPGAGSRAPHAGRPVSRRRPWTCLGRHPLPRPGAKEVGRVDDQPQVERHDPEG